MGAKNHGQPELEYLVVSRRQYLIARNKDKTAFIKSQPYFPEDIDELKGIIIAESMHLRNLPLNHMLVEPNTLSDKVAPRPDIPGFASDSCHL
jgi:hypothetical protein